LKFFKESLYFVFLLIIWFSSLLFYQNQYFFRIIPSVLSKEWVSDYNITIYHVGEIYSYFFYSYLICQIIAGILIKKFNELSVLFFTCLFHFIGILLLIYSYNFEMLFISQLILGAMGGFAIVLALNIGRKIVNIEYSSFLNGIIFMVGGLGALLAQIPVEYFMNFFSWRHILFVNLHIDLLICLTVVFSFIKIKDVFKKKKVSTKSSKGLYALMGALCSWNLWGVSLYVFFQFMSMVGFINLWLHPFINIEYSKSPHESSFYETAVYLGYIIGSPLMGLLGKWFFHHKKVILILSSLFGFFVSLGLIYVKINLISIEYILLFLLGFFMSCISVAISILRDNTIEDELPISLGVSIFFSNLGGAIVLILIGYLLKLESIKLGGDTLESYRHALVVVPLSFFLAFIVSLFIRSKIRVQSRSLS
jgi:MFS family permease